MESPPTPLTAGQQLRQTRQARKLALEQAAQATRIRVRYLEALENDDFTSLPSVAQGRGFLRAYALYLKMDPAQLLYLLDHEAQPAPAQAPPTQLPATPTLPSSESEAILAEIGSLLRRQRELLGISLEDVERHTHLRSHNLKSLEQGRLQQLPSPVQARGMLSNYAAFLGLDPEPLLLRFAEGLQARLAERQVVQPGRKSLPQEARQPNVLRRFFSIDLLIGTALVIFLVTFISWTALRISNVRTNQTATATSPSIAEILAQGTSPADLLTPDPAQLLTETFAVGTPASGTLDPLLAGTPGLELEPSATAGPDETIEPAALPAATPTVYAVTSGTAVQVNIIVRQRAWMRVLVDGEVGFEGRVVPDSVYVFAGNDQVQVLTGNGAALQVFYNSQDLGTLGILGEVVDRTFTPEGMETPAPSPTPADQSQATPTLPPGLIFPTPGVP